MKLQPIIRYALGAALLLYGLLSYMPLLAQNAEDISEQVQNHLETLDLEELKQIEEFSMDEAFTMNSLSKEKKKELKRSFQVSKSDLLDISTSWGDVTISFWNKPEVEIRTVITSQHSSEKVAQQIIDGIEVDMSKSGNRVLLEIKKSKNRGINNAQFTIRSYISMPADLNINANLRYGGLSLQDTYKGKGDFDLSYTNLKAEDFTNKLQIKIKYGNITMGNFSTADIDAAYGKLHAGKGNSLRMLAKYCSSNRIDAIKDLDLDARYSDFKLNSVSIMNVDIRYGTIEIAELTEILDVSSCDYSKLNLRKLSAGFSRVNLTGRYANIQVAVPSTASFNVHANKMRYGDFNISGFNTSSDTSDTSRVSVKVNNGGNKSIRFDGDQYSKVKVYAY